MSQFIEVRICKYCSGIVKENTRMEHSYCTECSIIEGGDINKYECQECLSICEEEICNCGINDGVPDQ